MTTTAGSFTIKLTSNGRQCGDCQLCCRLLPVPTVNDKPANQRCEHQRHGKGCNVYARRPHACRTFSCRWLTDEDVQDLRRPDRAHYVIDVAPDFLRVRDDATDKITHLPVYQIWCDPKHPDAHRDPALRAWIENRSRAGFAAFVRYGSRLGLALIPPTMTHDRQWMEKEAESESGEHTAEEIFRAISGR